MGKGDKKTKKGKIIMGSFGVSRKKRSKNVVYTPKLTDKEELNTAEISSTTDKNEVNKSKKVSAKKENPKKETAKKESPKKKPSENNE